jgi:transposase
VNLHARNLGINPCTAMRWWKYYQETGKVAYKKLQRNPGRPNSLTPEHEQHIQQIVEKDSQLCADDIIISRKSQFEDLKISKSQMNHHLRNNMLISIKKPTFDPVTRSSDNNLQTRYEWFIKWKGSNLGYTKNCVFIDGAALRTVKQKKKKSFQEAKSKEQATLLLKSLL